MGPTCLACLQQVGRAMGGKRRMKEAARANTLRGKQGPVVVLVVREKAAAGPAGDSPGPAAADQALLRDGLTALSSPIAFRVILYLCLQRGFGLNGKHWVPVAVRACGQPDTAWDSQDTGEFGADIVCLQEVESPEEDPFLTAPESDLGGRCLAPRWQVRVRSRPPAHSQLLLLSVRLHHLRRPARRMRRQLQRPRHQRPPAGERRKEQPGNHPARSAMFRGEQQCALLQWRASFFSGPARATTDG